MYKEKPPWWVKPLANLIAALIIGICGYLWEFSLNPQGNYTVYVDSGKGQIGIVGSLPCGGDQINWRFSIDTTWYRSKKTYAKLLTWTKSGETVTRVSYKEVREGQGLSFTDCSGKDIEIAYIYDVSTTEPWMHLRVHPDQSIEVIVDRNLPILLEDGK